MYSIKISLFLIFILFKNISFASKLNEQFSQDFKSFCNDNIAEDYKINPLHNDLKLEKEGELSSSKGSSYEEYSKNTFFKKNELKPLKEVNDKKNIYYIIALIVLVFVLVLVAFLLIFFRKEIFVKKQKTPLQINEIQQVIMQEGLQNVF